MTPKARCILVDDDPSFLALTHEFLLSLHPDWLVMGFRDGFDALDFVSHHRVDLLITDFRMPSVDGLRLTSLVRALDARLPILVMSGEDIGRQAMDRGADGFVPKLSLMSDLPVSLGRLRIRELQA